MLNPIDVELLRPTELRKPDLGQGEAEALIQARDIGARYFIGDERRAREVASNLGLQPVGTIRLLARLHREGLAEDPRQLVQKLRQDLGCFVADDVVADAIARAHEPI